MNNYFLHQRVLEADLEGVQQVLLQGADLNELDTQGHSALHWAVFGGYVDIVKVLLEAGADPNIFSKDGVTPKWRAQDFGLVEIEQLLTAYGGKVDTDNNFDRTSFSVFNHAIGRSLPKEEK
ncbi:MAG TPA: ankyrin repeat domain-containing protein [Flavisolibacter sp.]|nr:ankyrin repeat domain-containing protein [Flavisolibacter sp.]